MPEKEVGRYISFFKKYYPIENLKLCIVTCNEEEWKALHTWTHNMRTVLEQMLQESESPTNHCEILPIGESHDPDRTITWKDSIGYFIPVPNLKWFIYLDKQNKEALEPLKKAIEGKDYFIMLRKTPLKTENQFLVTLFHEILHIIEGELQIPIFRGSTVKDEVRDDREIVFPFVKKFLGEKYA